MAHSTEPRSFECQPLRQLDSNSPSATKNRYPELAQSRSEGSVLWAWPCPQPPDILYSV